MTGPVQTASVAKESTISILIVCRSTTFLSICQTTQTDRWTDTELSILQCTQALYKLLPNNYAYIHMYM